MLMQFSEMLMTVIGNIKIKIGLWDCFRVNDLTLNYWILEECLSSHLIYTTVICIVKYQ